MWWTSRLGTGPFARVPYRSACRFTRWLICISARAKGPAPSRDVHHTPSSSGPCPRLLLLRRALRRGLGSSSAVSGSSGEAGIPRAQEMLTRSISAEDSEPIVTVFACTNLYCERDFT